MLDERLREQLTTHGLQLAEEIVPPDVNSLMRRGRQRRRRRATSAAAACLGVVLGIAAPLGLQGLGLLADRLPAAEPSETVTPFEFDAGDHIPAGTYELPLWREGGAPATARLTVPDGWSAAGGVFHGFRGGVAEVDVLDVDQVTAVPCRAVGLIGRHEPGMTSVGNSPDALVRALLRLPGQTVVDGPREVRKFDGTAVHLTLQVSRDEPCAPLAYEMWSGLGNGSRSAAPGSRMDLWVVDVSGEAALVAAIADDGAPAWVEGQMQDVVDSVHFAQPTG